MPRPYVLKQRADTMAETRQRIVDAAVHLHGTLGPARTTISAIAARAGVERLTVYRHFADETAIFQACTQHWLGEHPPPAPDAWTDADPVARLRHGLGELYGYYGRTRAMWRLGYRDVEVTPALAGPFAQWLAYLDAAAARLLEPFGRLRAAPRRRLHTALRHAVDFRTWASLAGDGGDDDTAIALMVAMVRGARDPAV